MADQEQCNNPRQLYGLGSPFVKDGKIKKEQKKLKKVGKAIASLLGIAASRYIIWYTW